MAVNLESHGLPAAAPYGASVTVQDHQGEGHGQQPAQDAGYSATSAFELANSASVPQTAVEDQGNAGGGDLLARLTGFIKAVGNVVVQLGEYIRSAGAALNGDAPAEAPAQAPQAPALGAPAGAPGATGPGGQSALGAPGQPITSPSLPAQAQQAGVVPLPDLRGGTALGARSPAPTQRDAAKLAAEGTGPASAGLQLATAAVRAGGRPPQSSGFPVLNPLPPYLGDEIAPIFDFGGEPEHSYPAPPVDVGGEIPEGINQGHSATARPPVQPSELSVAAFPAQVPEIAQAAEAADLGYVNNVIPFPAPAANDGFANEAGAGESAQLLDAAASAEPRYQAIVFRPAFYGFVRC
jgi:hypothetical protein